MQRPVMNPMFDPDPVPSRCPGQGSWWLACLVVVGRAAWVILRRVARVLLVDLVRLGRARQRVDGIPPLQRLIRGLAYRLLFVPVLIVLVAAVMVYFGTHPTSTLAYGDPIGQGVYYDPVTFLSEDGVRLEAWLVPVLDARKILCDKEQALQERQPALVLVHDFGCSRQQMLPLVAPLHDAGYVVMVTSVRGSSPTAGGPGVGSTFGLNEAMDVRAAVQRLRRTPFVDARRVGVLGIGTGATACLIAAHRDPEIAAMILDQPLHSFDDVVARFIGPHQRGLDWINPVCKWTFEVAYGTDGNDLNIEQFAKDFSARPTLLYDSANPLTLTPAHARQVVAFCNARLKTRPLAATTSARE